MSVSKHCKMGYIHFTVFKQRYIIYIDTFGLKALQLVYFIQKLFLFTIFTQYTLANQ